jgi:hypothetical protein
VLGDPRRHALALTWAVALGVAALARGRLDGPRTILASAGLLAAAGTASWLSPARTQGRDAVRVLGRTAVAVPAFRLQPGGAAEWTGDVLGWGPLYEPHRHPGGALLGGRLALPAGRYQIVLFGDELGSDRSAVLEVRTEQAPAALRTFPFRREGSALVADFEAVGGALDLRLRGGAPRLVRRIRLAAQPSAPGPV